MYESYFGLGTRPFALQPDPAFIYWSDQHRRAADFLSRGAASARGDVLVLHGAVGAGKTTLIMEFVRNSPADMEIVLVRNIPPHVSNALPWIAAAAGLQLVRTVDAAEALHGWLDEIVAEGRRVTIVIDEAQNLRAAALDSIVPLLTRDGDTTRNLLLVLVGQPELPVLLRRPENAAIARRVVDSIRLGRMKSPDTHAYIRHRLELGGAVEPIFDDDAMELIHRAADGVPRMVNLIADQLLVGAYADDRQDIDLDAAAEILSEAQAPALSAIPVAAIRNQLSREFAAVAAAFEPGAKPAVSDRSTGGVTAGMMGLDEGEEDPKSREASLRNAAFEAAALAGDDDDDFDFDPVPDDPPDPEHQGMAEDRASFVHRPAAASDQAATAEPQAAQLPAVVPSTPSRLRGLAISALIAVSLAGVAFVVMRPDIQPAPEVVETAPDSPTAAQAPEPTSPAPETAPPAPETAQANDPDPAPSPITDEASRLAAETPVELRAALDLARTAPAAAAIVLARTAIAGSDRAAYYLGQLHETGDGVAFDPALAASWYRLAADTLPEAEASLVTADASGFAQPLADPRPRLAARVQDRLDLVWEGSGTAREYRVEIADEDQAVLATRDSPVPAARIELPAGAALWRVTAVGADDAEIVGDWSAIPGD